MVRLIVQCLSLRLQLILWCNLRILQHITLSKCCHNHNRLENPCWIVFKKGGKTACFRLLYWRINKRIFRFSILLIYLWDHLYRRHATQKVKYAYAQLPLCQWPNKRVEPYFQLLCPHPMFTYMGWRHKNGLKWLIGKYAYAFTKYFAFRVVYICMAVYIKEMLKQDLKILLS